MISINELKVKAREAEEENYIFRTFLKGQEPDELDEIVNELHNELFNEVDCKTCLNCCKVIRPVLNDEDIQRISSHIGMIEEEFVKEYLGESEGDLFLKDRPCKFLSEEGCTIYENRPQVCREYPFTNQKEIVFSLYNLIGNSSTCPVVYEILERLKTIYKDDFEDYKVRYSYLWESTTPTIKKKSKIGRNEPCPCGSGKKYKRCCGKLG